MNLIELRRKVLEKLQVVAAGEPVVPSDAQVVADKYESLHEILLQNNLVSWAVQEDIPELYKSIIVPMVAAECVDEFYVPDNLKASIIAEGKFDMPGMSLAERRLRKLVSARYNEQPATSEYF